MLLIVFGAIACAGAGAIAFGPPGLILGCVAGVMIAGIFYLRR